MSWDHYKPRTLSGATKEVRSLRKMLAANRKKTNYYARMVRRLHAGRSLMALLAADTPQFSNPILLHKAKKLRDQILNGEL